MTARPVSPWHCPYCDAPPFAVPSLRDQHIREEHPEEKRP